MRADLFKTTARVLVLLMPFAAFAADTVPVAVASFARAETDNYFRKFENSGAFGKLVHRRDVATIDKQEVIRMNRDTLYSNGVFDLDAAPVTITLPPSGKRYMALQVISQDHYTSEVVYAPIKRTYTRQLVGTRYVLFIIRTMVDPQDPNDVKVVNALQDSIKVEQAKPGAFEVPNWDQSSLDKIRNALLVLAAAGGYDDKKFFGSKDQVDPVSFLIGTAGGWGGNPAYAAVYLPVFPKQNDGSTVHTLTVKDVPVDGFWSISIYNEKGFFEKNDRNGYSVNNVTAKPNPDGSYTVQFGGCTASIANCLPIPKVWNYIVRLYRPRKPILDGTWKFPEAQPKQ